MFKNTAYSYSECTPFITIFTYICPVKKLSFPRVPLGVHTDVLNRHYRCQRDKVRRVESQCCVCQV